MKIDNQQKVMLGIVGMLVLGLMAVTQISTTPKKESKDLLGKDGFLLIYAGKGHSQRKDLSKKIITRIQKEQDELVEYLTENWNQVTIDGSTSMKPLHQALNDKFGDKNKIISHSKTVDAFESFVDGENDILLGVSYSDELLSQAEESGIDLVSREITREAFVFLVNKNNPVQELTVKQLQGIYSGKITNWKDVGGDDEEIVAYQRNENSGSQIRMKKFMGEIPLAEKIYIADGMGELILYVAEFTPYSNDANPIGYNMYTFVDKQYGDEDIKLVNVDGVKPTDQTIFDETYPIVIYNYIYHDENNEFATEFADKLYSYLMSDEGQELIGEAGYVNVKKQTERKEIDEYLDEGYYYYDESKRTYDLEKGEFYELDEYGRVKVYDNYPDFLLPSRYKNNKNARNYLMKFQNGKFIPYAQWVNSDNGTIVLDTLIDNYDFYREEMYNFRYNGLYYKGITYYINEDKYVLTVASSEYKDLVEGSKRDKWFPADEIATEDIEITESEFNNLYVRKNYWQTGDFDDMEYFQPFKTK